jgi:antitoxin HicB
MQTWTYPAVIQALPDDEWLVTFPNIPQINTSGDSRAEALANAADALEEMVLAQLANGLPVPPPRESRDGETPVDLDPVTAARAALVQAMAEANMYNVALAKRLNKSEGAIRRLTHGSTGVKIDTLIQALHALGRRAALTVG